jgi:glycine betaine/choline ABC-type transport system substrate-binding protein
MKKIFLFLCMLSCLVSHQGAEACVGKTLYIGVTNSPHEFMYAEIISILVTERTGTSVKIVTYKDAKDMYSAVKKGEVGVVIESADRALRLMSRPAEANAKASYDAAKKVYRQDLNLVWLEPFGGSRYYSPVVSVETINNLPALPKLLNKLAGLVNDTMDAKLLGSVKAGGKPEKVARDFLKSRKLI